MSARVRLWAALACLQLAVPSTAVCATTERLSIISNGEKVGALEARIDGARITVDYRVDNNGRGPKHHEALVIGPDRIPVTWTVSGTSLMGGVVDERFRWTAGEAKWKSQADEGSAKASSPPLYIVNDDSPWAAGIYARAALLRPARSIPVLPAGRLSLAKVRQLTIGAGKAATNVTVYRLSGVQLNPTYVMLDPGQRLFGTFGGGEGEVVVRSGYEAAAGDILELNRQLEAERAAALQRRLGHRFAMPVRIRNVRIFDPSSGALSTPSTVVVMRDTISQVIPNDSAPAPVGETVIEGEGGTLYPGLHDMHSHATLQSGLLYLAAGVTATRDMGNDNGFMLDLIAKEEAGEVAWPRITPNGFLEGRSAYSARMGFIPATIDEAIRDVGWYADHGYFEIKIYNSMPPDWVRPIAAEAHRRGMGVTGHVPAFDTPDRVIADGYDTIAHANQLMLGWILRPDEDTRTPLRLTAMARAGALDLGSAPVRRTVALMKAHRTALDTTASILEQLMLSRAGQVPPGQSDFLSHLPVGFQRYRKRSYVTLRGAADDQAYRSGFAKVLAVMKMLHEQGIRLLPGTDDATGFSLLRELELYVQAGYTPAESLRAATLDCEQYLRRTDRLGTIEKGKLADLVLVPGDPTRDISAIRRPRMVMKGGRVYFPSEIYAALGIAPFTTAPAVTPAKAERSDLHAQARAGFGGGADAVHD